MVSDRKPRGYWGAVFAIGLALTPLSGQTQEQAQDSQRSPDRNEQPPETPRRPIPIEIIESQESASADDRSEAESRQREIDDLAAQKGMNRATQAMNDATQRMANYALYSTIAVFVGTGLLIWTLWETRRALRITREIGRDQMQAYVHAHSASVGNWHPRPIQIDIRNTGQTPAKNISVYSAVSVIETDPDVAKRTACDGATIGHDWGSLENSGRYMMRVDIPLFIVSDMIEAVQRANGKKTLLFAGRVKYTTMFDEIYTTEFLFHANQITIGYKSRQAGGAEIPYVLSRAPTNRKAYHRHD